MPADIPRFAKLHVITSVQPYHAIDDGRWAEKRIGTARIRATYAFRSLMDSGTVVAFGSDWPVGPLVPFIGIYAAKTPQTIGARLAVRSREQMARKVVEQGVTLKLVAASFNVTGRTTAH